MRHWLLFVCLSVLFALAGPLSGWAKSSDSAVVTVTVRVEPTFRVPPASLPVDEWMNGDRSRVLSNEPRLQWKVTLVDEPAPDRTRRRVVYWVVLPAE